MGINIEFGDRVWPFWVYACIGLLDISQGLVCFLTLGCVRVSLTLTFLFWLAMRQDAIGE